MQFEHVSAPKIVEPVEGRSLDTKLSERGEEDSVVRKAGYHPDNDHCAAADKTRHCILCFTTARQSDTLCYVAS